MTGFRSGWNPSRGSWTLTPLPLIGAVFPLYKEGRVAHVVKNDIGRSQFPNHVLRINVAMLWHPLGDESRLEDDVLD